MKVLAVSALLCAIVALTAAAPASEEEAAEEPVDSVEVVKRDTQGWTKAGTRYFRYEARELTWDEAEGNCRSLGGHLASVHSYMEYSLIQSLITPSGDPVAWLGGTDRLQEGVWQWSDGTDFIYRFWCTGEPNNYRNEDCLQMSVSNYKCWNDSQCGHRHPSLCVKRK